MITTIPKDVIVRAQERLARAGLDVGAADGDPGPRTLQAMASYLVPSAPRDIGPILNRWLPVGAINTRDRVVAFFGHVAHESGFAPRRENMNYSVAGLLGGFSRQRISTADAKRLGRIEINGRVTQVANQAEIANTIYGGPWGLKNLGNTQPGDGWKFRGGGGIQNTGRAGYREAGKRVGLDLEAHPEIVTSPDGSIAGAVGFWIWKDLNSIVDRPGDTTESETLKINGGLKGLAERREFQARLAALLT